MASKFFKAAVNISAVGDHPQDNTNNSADGVKKQEGISDMKATMIITDSVAQQSGHAEAVGVDPAGVPAGSSTKPPEMTAIAIDAKKNPQVGVLKKTAGKNVAGKEVEATKAGEKARGDDTKASDVKKGDEALQTLHAAQKHRKGSGIGARKKQTQLVGKVDAAACNNEQKEARAIEKNAAENLDLEVVSKMAIPEKHKMFTHLLMNRLCSIHPALYEKLMASILMRPDREIVKMVKDQTYLVLSMQTVIAKLHESGFYEHAKNDEVFNMPGCNLVGKPRRK